jgi:hypothetical protein
MGSTVAIIVTGIALLLGFLILRKVNDDDGGGASVKPSNSTETTLPTETSLDPTATTLPLVTEAPTTLAPITTGTKVQVANASTVDGAAGKMTTALTTKGFEMAEAVSASEKVDNSKVLFSADVPGAEAVAKTLGAMLGNIEVAAQGIPTPTATGTWAEGSGVILMLGNDYAGKTLAEISGQPATGVTVPPSST